MSLKQRLIEQIALEGPISVAEYMTRCLFDPKDGYYATRPAIGAEGDFITAPMVSQMFGEMIGVWVAQVWRNMGSPSPFRLVEIGGGDGTLMSDIRRVMTHVPGLTEAARIIMVEPSTPLRSAQAERLPEAAFVSTVEDIPADLPLIIIANEVLDCLPARQFVRTAEGWHERRIGVVDGGLVFGLVEAGPDFTPPFDAALGEIVEVSPAQARFAAQIAGLIRQTSGAALLIDYGRDAPGSGDTLQALYRHKKHGPLDAPGEHDLTMWADFPMGRETAVSTGVKCPPIMTQSQFLGAIGIAHRLDALRSKNPGQADVLQRQYDMLCASDQMGELFKVLAFAFPPHVVIPGLEDEPPTP